MNRQFRTATPATARFSRSRGEILSLMRREIWRHHHHTAEVLLDQAAERANRDPASFNLLGVLHEAEALPQLAKKFYVRAIRTNGDYEPASSNLRRLEELDAYGHTRRQIALGAESEMLVGFLGRIAVRELDVLRNRLRN